MLVGNGCSDRLEGVSHNSFSPLRSYFKIKPCVEEKYCFCQDKITRVIKAFLPPIFKTSILSVSLLSFLCCQWKETDSS